MGLSARERGVGDRGEGRTVERARIAVNGVAARPLRYNAYKVPLLRNLVKRAIRGVPEVPER